MKSSSVSSPHLLLYTLKVTLCCRFEPIVGSLHSPLFKWLSLISLSLSLSFSLLRLSLSLLLSAVRGFHSSVPLAVASCRLLASMPMYDNLCVCMHACVRLGGIVYRIPLVKQKKSHANAET